MKRYQNPRQTLVFVFIAALLMVFTDFFFFPMQVTQGPPGRDFREKIYERSEIEDYELGMATPEDKDADELLETFSGTSVGIPQPEAIKNNGDEKSKIMSQPASLKIAPGIVSKEKRARVVVIIDDMGMDRKRSREAIDLPAPVTLAFLPYAPKLDEITKEAKDKGHELLIHAPMAATDSRLYEGPLALMDGMTREDFDATLNHMFDSFTGYVGVNNHMGSKLTQDEEAMNWLMEALAKRNLLFVDSKTIAASVAEKVAAEHGLAHSGRDVFLDNEDTPEFVEDSLRKLEALAHKKGYAIAIGHPRDSTIAALKKWIPELKSKNLVLVPVSAVAKKTEAISSVSSSEVLPAAGPPPPHE